MKWTGHRATCSVVVGVYRVMKWTVHCTMSDVQCAEDVAGAEETSDLSTNTQSQQLSTPLLSTVTPSSQQTSTPMLSVPEASIPLMTAAEPDNILTNTPPPVSKPTDRLVPLDLQPFVRYRAVCTPVLLICS